MPRSLTAALIAAAAFVLVPHVALAQGQAKGPPAASRWSGQGSGRGGLRRLPRHRPDPRRPRLHARSLEAVDRHHDRPVAAPDTQNEIIDYLATNFPPNKRRKPTLVSGNFEVTFNEWVMPQLGQRTRDPMQHADGSIWYAGQYGNLIGRLDPRTGQAKEYPLPPDSMPHTVQLDPRAGPGTRATRTARRLDRSRDRQGDRLQDARPEVGHAHDRLRQERHPVLQLPGGEHDRAAQSGHRRHQARQGRRTERSQPYDVKFAPDGTLWVSCNARPCLLKVNPETMEVTEIPFPLGGIDAPLRHRAGRHDLVQQFEPRRDRPAQPEDRRVQGMGIAVGPALASVRHRRARRRRLVQRVRHAARSAGALRHRDRDVPELADQVRQHLRRHPAQRAHDAGGQPPDPPDRHQPHHRGDAAAPRRAAQ